MARRSVRVGVAFESGFPASEATAVVVDRDGLTRVRRALAVMGLCCALAFLGVFVPLMHFVLPFVIVMTGVFFGVGRLRERVSLVELRCACPRCKEDKVLAVSGPFKDQRSLRCDQCAEKMTLSVTATA